MNVLPMMSKKMFAPMRLMQGIPGGTTSELKSGASILGRPFDWLNVHPVTVALIGDSVLSAPHPHPVPDGRGAQEGGFIVNAQLQPTSDIAKHPRAGAQLTGAEVVVQVLVDEGTDVVFGYSGGAILPVYDAVFRHNAKHRRADGSERLDNDVRQRSDGK